eukprot:GFYU01008798.1.p1 GENE.GFYU01008798.1~~GFYU01008798.1.p1  ORF type:complete len:170 (+),score=44.51 GFYU01008798.1:57-512(+)
MWPVTKAGEHALLPCGTGYKGHKRRLCDASGMFGPVDESACEPIFCEQPGWTKTPVGESAELPCRPGHSGVWKRLCEEDGKFGHVISTCRQLYCAEDVDGEWAKTVAGTTAVSDVCPNGMVGERSRKCNINGEWEEEDVSACVSAVVANSA